MFVERDSDALHTCDNHGALPVHVACRYNPPYSTIRYLVEQAPCTPRAYDYDGAQPLHALSESTPSVEAFNFLMRSYPEAVSTMTRTAGDLPFMLACDEASEGVIYALLRENPRVFLDIVTGLDLR